MDYISQNYERKHLYTGRHGYHAHHGAEFNKPRGYSERKYRIGVELEVEFFNSTAAQDFKDAKSNWFYLERDGSIGQYGWDGVEIITIPLRPQDAKSLDFWADNLTHHICQDANSWDTNGRCGLHVHIGNERLGRHPLEVEESRAKVIYLHEHFLRDHEITKRVYGRDRSYHETSGWTIEGDNASQDDARVILKKARGLQTSLKDATIARNRTTRYHAINITNPHTTEFRLGRGTLNAMRIAAVVEWCDLQCEYARGRNWGQICTEDFFHFVSLNASDNLMGYIREWIAR